MTSNIDGRLRAWRLERLAALWAEGGARLAAAAGAAVLGAAALDRLVGLPREARWGLFAAGAAGLAAGAAVWLIRPLRLLEAGRVLDAAAQRWPEARGFLRSAWELARAPLSAATSEALAERHIEAAERAAAVLPRDILFPVGLEARSKRRLAGVACLWAGVLPLLGGPHALSRVLFPWREAPLESELEVAPGDARPSWGSSVELSARWRLAAPPAALALELRSPGGSWGVQAWDRWTGGTGVFRAERLAAPLEYRLVSRDRKTRAFRLTPVPFARFLKLSARVHRPGGTVEEVPLDGAAEVAALRGSWVVVRGLPDRALDRAWLEATSLGGPVPMARADDGAWEAGFPLQQDGTLRVHAEAEGGREPEPPAFALRALEDRPPEAALLSPAFAVETSRRERLPVAFEARDDYGLSSLALVYKVGGGPERVVPLGGMKPGATSHLGEYSWDLSAFPSGSKVEFRVRAVDNARPEPQAGYSPPGLVVLTDFESAHEEVERQWLGAEAQLAQLSQEELRMREALAAAAALPEGQRQERAQPLAAQDEELAKEWERAARGLDEFAKGMENDPYANPGMAESARALSDGVEGMRRKDLPAARAAQKAGDLPQAEKRHAELQAKVRRAGELLAAGREMQSMQDLWAEAQRMEQAGGEIAGALEKMAAGQPPSAAEKKKLDEAMRSLHEQMEDLARAIARLPKAPDGSAAAERRKIYQVPLGDARQSMSALEAALARGDYAEAAKQAAALAKRLQDVHKAMARAAQEFAESADQSPNKRLSELEAAWKEAAEAQARALESVAAVEESRLAERTKAQQALVDALVSEQRAAVKEGERLGSWLPPGPLPDMRAVLAELEARRVREAPERLARAADGLSAQAAALSPEGAAPPQPAKDMAALAEAERSILKRLKDSGGGAPMTEEQLSQAFSAGAVQRQASKKASDLEPMMDGLSRDYGLDMGKAGAELSAARAEQGAAEQALGHGDTSGGQAAQERALEHLRKGAEAASESRRQSESIRQGSEGPFGRPRGTSRPYGKGGRTGSDTSFVPLPGVQEYMPPRAIRGEVERSLQEKRPAAFDKAVDDYLRRLSQ